MLVPDSLPYPAPMAMGINDHLMEVYIYILIWDTVTPVLLFPDQKDCTRRAIFSSRQ